MYEMCGAVSLFLLKSFPLLVRYISSPYLLYLLLISFDSSDFDKPLHHGMLKKNFICIAKSFTLNTECDTWIKILMGSPSFSTEHNT